MDFFNTGIDVLGVIVIGIGAGILTWGIINLLEGYSSENPASRSQGIKQAMAGGGIALIGVIMIPLLKGLFTI